MSDITIEECIAKLEKFGPRIAEEGKNIMKVEVPVGPKGKLKESVTSSVSGDTVEVTASAPYAHFVVEGRGPVKPHGPAFSRRTGKHNAGQFKKGFLKYTDYVGTQTSIHDWGDAGRVVYKRSVGPAKPNNFPLRTKERLQSLIQSIWDSL